MSEPGKIAIVPCSGVGKSYGTVTRTAAHLVTEQLRPGATTLVALAPLVLGDEAARAVVSACPALAIDGCQLACATKMVQASGGTVARTFTVLDTYRRHRDLKPQGIAELNENGLRLARVLAEEIAATIDEVQHA